MKILIIDNMIDRDCWGSQDLCELVRKVSKDTIYVRRAPHDDLPTSPKTFDRIILSGSKTSALDDAPWISQLHHFVRKAVDLGKPFLGVCYGHQTLVRALGGKANVRKADSPELGWTQIKISEPSSLMEGLPSTFYSFSSHYDEVSELPTGMKRLAFSKDCLIQACQLEKLPIYGIQFHPEKNLEDAKNKLLEKKRTGFPTQLLNPDCSDDLYDPQIGETLFTNFLLNEK